MEGDDGKTAVCRNPDKSLAILCEDPGFPRRLAHVSHGRVRAPVPPEVVDEGTERRLRHRRVLILLGFLFAIVVGGYSAIVITSRIAVAALPITVDEEIGAEIMSALDLGDHTVTDPVVVSAMEEIVDRLDRWVPVSGFDYRVVVVDIPIPNAFAVPGGNIVVFTGLIEFAETPEEVAGVLAHEMAHVYRRHGLKAISQSQGVTLALQVLSGDSGGMTALGGECLSAVAVSNFSRKQENEADAEGIRNMLKAGVNPMGLASLFARLDEQYGDVSDEMSWISSHPQHKERVATIHRIVADEPSAEYTPFGFSWDDVRSRASSTYEMPIWLLEEEW
jgi:Zn-dependent protease with chaperone function